MASACPIIPGPPPIANLAENTSDYRWAEKGGDTMAGSPEQYRVLVGINYPPDNRRAEIGDIVDDLPDYAIPGLLKAEVIAKVKNKEVTK